MKLNLTLTNYARGLSQELQSAVAKFIAPEVPVGVTTGQYKSFDDGNAFQVLDTQRALGGGAKRIEFLTTDPTFNCQPHALEIPIDVHEREGYGEGDPLGLERAKTRTLVHAAVLSHEKKVLDILNAGVSAEAGLGDAWSGADDPVAELDAVIESLATEMGRMPNRMVIGLPAWKIIRHNAKVLAKFPGASKIGVNASQFASLLMADVQIQIGVLSYNQNKTGKAASKSNLVGSEVYVFYGSDSPDVYDPSAMKTFRTKSGGVDSVRMYQEPSGRADILAVDWTEDIKLTSAASIKRITVG